MNENYPLQHWLTTLLLAPFLPPIYEMIFEPRSGQILSLLEVYFISLVFSFIFSLPTLFIYYLVFRFIAKRNIKPLAMKFILIVLTIMGITITLLLIGGSLVPTLIFAYSLAAILTGFLFKIKKRTNLIMTQSV